MVMRNARRVPNIAMLSSCTHILVEIFLMGPPRQIQDEPGSLEDSQHAAGEESVRSRCLADETDVQRRVAFSAGDRSVLVLSYANEHGRDVCIGDTQDPGFGARVASVAIDVVVVTVHGLAGRRGAGGEDQRNADNADHDSSLPLSENASLFLFSGEWPIPQSLQRGTPHHSARRSWMVIAVSHFNGMLLTMDGPTNKVLFRSASFLLVTSAALYGLTDYLFSGIEWAPLQLPVELVEDREHTGNFVAVWSVVYEIRLDTDRNLDLQEQNCLLGIETVVLERCADWLLGPEHGENPRCLSSSGRAKLSSYGYGGAFLSTVTAVQSALAGGGNAEGAQMDLRMDRSSHRDRHRPAVAGNRVVDTPGRARTGEDAPHSPTSSQFLFSIVCSVAHPAWMGPRTT